MKSTAIPVLAATFTLAMLPGCTLPSRGTLYDRNTAGRSMNVEVGDVMSVREVQLTGRNTIIGTGGGGLVGHAAGSGIGTGGVGTAIAAAGGAVVGAVAGEAVEEAATRKTAQEITIKTNTGDTIAVVQPVSVDGAFTVGEHVQILRGSGDAVVRRF